MKKLFLAMTLIFTSLVCVSSSFATTYGDVGVAVYIRNYDGDTITFDLPSLHPLIGQKISIRVKGIDTPEIRGKCDREKFSAQQVKLLVAEILKGSKRITLKNVGRGKYFRIVADVIVDGKSLTDMLIGSGMAVAYDGGTKTYNWCGE